MRNFAADVTPCGGLRACSPETPPRGVDRDPCGRSCSHHRQTRSPQAESPLKTVIVLTMHQLAQSLGVGDLYRIYVRAQREQAGYHAAWIGRDFNAPWEGWDDPRYMRALFDYGYTQAVNGQAWHSEPPGEPGATEVERHTTRPQQVCFASRGGPSPRFVDRPLRAGGLNRSRGRGSGERHRHPDLQRHADRTALRIRCDRRPPRSDAQGAQRARATSPRKYREMPVGSTGPCRVHKKNSGAGPEQYHMGGSVRPVQHRSHCKQL